jgi:hypothetical protein
MTTTHHQPGQDVFRSILSQDIDFQPFAAFPPGVMLAVVVGHPSETGPFTIRVKVVLPGETPHFHWAKSGEYITQVTALGPISLDYVHPNDDPRR